MAKLSIEMLCEGKVLEAIKQGIIYPANIYTIYDDDLEKAPEEANKKVDEYNNGKQLFLTGVRIMADAILPKLSLTSKRITVTLTAEEE